MTLNNGKQWQGIKVTPSVLLTLATAFSVSTSSNENTPITANLI